MVVPLFVDAEGVPDFGWMDDATRAIAAGLKPGTLVSYETTLPVGTTRNRWAPMLEQGSGLTAGQDFHLVFSPERVLTGRVFADLRRYPKLVGGIDEASAAHGVALLRGGARLRRARRPQPPQRRVGPRLGRGVRAGQARRDDLPRRQHRPGEPVRPLRRHRRRRRHQGHRGLQHPAVQPHPLAGHRRRRALHPDLPADVPVERPGRHGRTLGPRGQRGHAGVRRRPARRRVRRPDRRGRAGARRRLPGRREGDRLLRRLPDRRGAARPGRQAVRLRPDVHQRGAGRARPAAATTASRSAPP